MSCTSKTTLEGTTFNIKLPKLSSMRLRVESPWYEEIEEGRATVLAVLKNVNVFSSVVGQGITLTTKTSEEKKEFSITLVSIQHYSSVETFLRVEGWKKVAPQATSAEEAAVLLEETLSAESVSAAGGVTALRLEL